jgi:RIO-like serine/threonine protein kinase
MGVVDPKGGFYGVTRFETMRSHTKMTKQTLANRLKKMTELDLLCKIPIKKKAHVSAMSMYSRQKAAVWRRSFFHNGMGA